MLKSLHWSPIDFATDPDGGEWSINSEQVRGEGRLYFLEDAPAWVRRLADDHGIDLAHHQKRVVKQRVERLRRLQLVAP